MLYFFSGTDTDKARAAMNAAVQKENGSVLRITDAHSRADLEMALQGVGLFGEKNSVVLDNVYLNDELRGALEPRLQSLGKSSDSYFMLEGALDAAMRKSIEKHATVFERFDAKSTKKQETIFALANALQAGKKKELWVGYQKELQAGKAAEAIHGVLFWVAKQMHLRQNSARSRAFVATLAELPHEARRNGEDLEYALERFVLSMAPAPHQMQ